RILRLISI
ncbi:hypothetical protein MPH_09248, partial [Macrophomina phaseolina MS6]